MTSPDPFDLARFLAAQDAGDTYGAALGELRDGRKESHWMWFVFPQVAGLGRSPTARRFAVSGLDEARAYLDHPMLGPRLRASTDAVLALTDTSATEVLGGVDALKLRSSMTLFARAAPDDARFGAVLEHWFGGGADDATVELLAA